MSRWCRAVAVACLGCLSLLATGCDGGETESDETSLSSRTAQVGPEAVEEESAESSEDLSLQWRERTVERSTGDCDGEPCARIVLAYPELTAGAPDEVLEQIDRTVVAWMSSDALGGISDQDLPAPPSMGERGEPEEPEPPTTDPLVERAEAFLDEYERFRQDVPSPVAAVSPWWQEIRAAVESRVGRVLTLRVDTESYTGGAHGLALTVYWLFDLATGEVLDLDDLVAEGEREALRRVVEARFREVRDLAPDEDLEEAGFFVISDGDGDGDGHRDGDGGKLPLTHNVAVTADGLVFQYHPYEVAPYAAGPTTVPVPWAELEGLVRRSP